MFGRSELPGRAMRRPARSPVCAAIVWLALGLVDARAALAAQVAPGVTYEQDSGYHVVVIDLDSDAVQVRVNRPNPSGPDTATVESHAQAAGAIAAINANYFDAAKGGACGAARGFADHFTRYYAEPPNCITTLGWARGIAELLSTAGHEGDGSFRPEFTEMVTGGGALLYSGTASWQQINMPVGRAMTAAGVTADRKRFVFLVTDAGTSNLARMQQTLQSHGVVDAVFLDGGGSTHLWLQGQGYVNQAEGADRLVPVAIMALPGGAPKPPSDAGPDAAPADADLPDGRPPDPADGAVDGATDAGPVDARIDSPSTGDGGGGLSGGCALVDAGHAPGTSAAMWTPTLVLVLLLGLARRRVS